jgi:hypothetical protein
MSTPLAANAVTQSTREEIGQRFDDTEAHNEGEDGCGGSQAEYALAEERHNTALKAYHATDKDVDNDQECELLPVGTQAKLND